MVGCIARRRPEALRATAGRHGVDLVAASLQFSLAPDVAAALIVGASTPGHILADHAALRATIPDAFWIDLREQGVLRRDAELPNAR